MRIFKNIGLKLRKLVTPSKEYGKPSGGFWPSRIRKTAWELCRDGKGRLLEAGCGEGLFLNLVDSSRFEIYGVEYLQKIVNLARIYLRNKDIKLQQGDIKNLDFQDNYFDVVVCVNTLYNLKDVNEVSMSIKEISRVCKPEGFIIIDIKNKLNPLISFQYGLAKYTDPDCGKPLKTYFLKEIEKILIKNNLKIEKIVSIGFPAKFIAPVLVIKAKKVQTVAVSRQ